MSINERSKIAHEVIMLIVLISLWQHFLTFCAIRISPIMTSNKLKSQISGFIISTIIFHRPSAQERCHIISNGSHAFTCRTTSQFSKQIFECMATTTLPLTSICLSRTRHRVDKRASNLFVLQQTAYTRPEEMREDQSTCPWLLLITWLPPCQSPSCEHTSLASSTIDRRNAHTNGRHTRLRSSPVPTMSFS